MPKNNPNRSAFSPRFVAGIKSQAWAKQSAIQASALRDRLLHHRDRAVQQFQQQHPQAHEWLTARNLDIGSLRLHSQKILALSSLSGALLLSSPSSPKLLPHKPVRAILAQAGLQPISASLTSLKHTLQPLIPHRVGHLDPDAQTQVTAAINQILGISATSTLEGQRLNHSLGWIGYEQHLHRFPGDSIQQHDAEIAAGIAPHTGAWGYFAATSGELTAELAQYEKYYVAVQTLYLPSWEQDVAYLRQWYRYRKVVLVNVENGQVVVAVIGDSGPASWTGKQFGGSPEVMRSLDLTGKKSKGKVLLLFVNDPENKVPLGPITQPVGEEIKLT